MVVEKKNWVLIGITTEVTAPVLSADCRSVAEVQ